MKPLNLITLCVLVASSIGCSFQYVARDVDTYRQDTRDLLSTKNGEIKSCYDEQLKADPNTGGTTVVKFTVQEETGQLINVVLDEEQSTAPDALNQCVLNAVDGLVLEPPDQREGVASFSWEFKVNS
jgi:hypothetical protein